ncbi:MAG TPA: hypothetical protein VF594_08795 [Rubricoccaceae bacterium]|jgi:hypothetical protein
MPARSTLALAALVALSACGDDPDVTVTTEPPPAERRTEAADASGDAPVLRGKPAARAEDEADEVSSPKDDSPAARPVAGSAEGGKPGAASVAERAEPAQAAGKPAPGASAPAAAGGAQTHAGTLEDGDETLDSGEFADGYTVEAAEGQTITVDLTSPDFDTYVILRSPSGEQYDNDDFDGDTDHSQIVQRAGESGTWRVIATTYEEGEGGAYRLAIRTGGR